MCVAGSSELRNMLQDTYEFEQRRRELREENRCNRECTPPTEELSYTMVDYLQNIVDRADGKPTTATIWNPHKELCDWEMLQDDGFTIIENNYNYELQETKDFLKVWGACTSVALIALAVTGHFKSRN